MTDNLTTLTRLADMLARDEGTLRRMAGTVDYQGAIGVSERLLEIADHLRAVRHPIETSIEQMRAARPVDPRRADVFGAYPSKYSPPNVQTAADGQLRTWHLAVDAATVYDNIRDGLLSSARADAWAAVLLRVRYLVRDCGEDATDPVAVNLCLDTLRSVTGMRLVPPDNI